MNPNIIVGIMLVTPVLLMMLLRVNAALVFLSLCLGNVLVQFAGRDTATLLGSAAAHTPGLPAQSPYTSLGLLLLPVFLTMLIMVHTVRGWRLALNILPAVGASALGSLLAVPLLSAGTVGAITHLSMWHQLQALQTLILGVSTLLCLLFLWMQRPVHSKESQHAKRH